MIEKQEAEIIAQATNAYRPDWPTKQILTIIGRDLINRPYRDVAIAFTYIATDPATRTPGRITEDGPWWTAVATTRFANAQPTRAPSPRNHETCKVDGHSGWAGNCPQCRADRLAQPMEDIA